MLATGDFNLCDEKGNVIVPEEVKQKTHVSNNYARPEGQVGASVGFPVDSV